MQHYKLCEESEMFEDGKQKCQLKGKAIQQYHWAGAIGVWTMADCSKLHPSLTWRH